MFGRGMRGADRAEIKERHDAYRQQAFTSLMRNENRAVIVTTERAVCEYKRRLLNKACYLHILLQCTIGLSNNQ